MIINDTDKYAAYELLKFACDSKLYGKVSRDFDIYQMWTDLRWLFGRSLD